jgi:hypothetical protein
VIFDYGQVVLFEEGEGLGRGDAAEGGVVLYYCVEVYGDFVVLDQMLEVGVSAILSY